MAVSKVDAANQIENQLPQANIANNVNFRNIIINGDMSIAQRSTSETGINSAGYRTVDRFRIAISSMGDWGISQSTTVPSGEGFTNSLKMDCEVAKASPTGGSQLIIQQRIEGQMLQYLKKGTSNAQKLTLSFWVRSNKTGTYIINILDNNNTRQISKSYTINTADTWEKKTLTFDGDTTGAFNNDANTSIELNFWLGAGSDYNTGTLRTSWTATTNADLAVGQVNLADSTDNEFYLTGVQLEAGEVASEFEFLPYDVNLHRCFRYYYQSDGTINTGATTDTWSGDVTSGNTYHATAWLPVVMRGTPSVGLRNVSASRFNPSSGYGGTHVSNRRAEYYATSDSTGRGYYRASLDVDAEL